MTDLTALHAEHLEIQRQAHQLTRMVMRPLPPYRNELERVRRDFTMRVGDHLRHEDAIVYPRLLQSVDGNVRAVVRRMIAESGALAASFDAFCRRWSCAAIVADWAGFRYAASELLAQIERRMAAESYELFPLLGLAEAGTSPVQASPDRTAVGVGSPQA